MLITLDLSDLVPLTSGSSAGSGHFQRAGAVDAMSNDEMRLQHICLLFVRTDGM